MKKRNYTLYIRDILDAIRKIDEYVKNLSFDEFRKNDMAIDAVIRNFEIIGEASKSIPSDIKSKYPSIPWKEMSGMRDKIIHEYFGVDLEIVWETVRNSLDPLKKSLKKIK